MHSSLGIPSNMRTVLSSSQNRNSLIDLAVHKQGGIKPKGDEMKMSDDSLIDSPIDSPIDQGSPFLKPLSHLQGGRDFYLVEGDTREVDAFGLSDWCSRTTSHKVLLRSLHLAYHIGCLLTFYTDKPIISSYNDTVFHFYADQMNRGTKKAFWALEKEAMESLIVKTHSKLDDLLFHLPFRLPSRLYLLASDDWKNFGSLITVYKRYLPAQIVEACNTLINSRRESTKIKTLHKLREALAVILSYKTKDWIFGSTTTDEDGKTNYFMAGLLKTRHIDDLSTPGFGTLVVRCK